MMKRFILLLALYLSAVSATESTTATPNMRKLDYGRPDRGEEGISSSSSATQQHRDLSMSDWWISLLNKMGVSCPQNVIDQCPNVHIHQKHCCESSHHSSSSSGGSGGGGDDDDDDSSSASDDGDDGWDDDGWDDDGHDDDAWEDDGHDDGDDAWDDDAWGSDGYINSAKNGATTSSESGRFKRQGLWVMGIMAALFAGLIALVVVRRKRRNAAREDVPENVYVEGGAIGTHDDVDHGDGNYNGGGRSKQGMSRVGSMKSSLSRGMGSIKSKFSRKKEADDDDDYEAHFDNDEYGGQSAYM